MTVSIGVIGGGPAALGTLLGLLESKKFSITVIAVKTSNTHTHDFNQQSYYKSNRSKRGYKPFETDENFQLNDNKSSQVPSNLVEGGWTSIWGGTLAKWGAAAEIHENVKAGDMQNEYETILSIIPTSNGMHSESGSGLIRSMIFDFKKKDRKGITGLKDFSVFNSNLAIWREGKRACVLCAKCLTGCKYESIYNANQTMEDLARDTQTQIGRVDKYVIKIEEKETKVKVYLEDGTHAEYDYVFVASGILSSVGLLQRSGYLPEVSIMETPMFLIPLFKIRGKTSEVQARITLSEAFIEIQNKSNGLIGSGQIYSFTENLREVAFKGILGAVCKILPNFLTKRIIIVMFFVKPLNEPPIVLSKKDGLTEITFPRSYSRITYAGVLTKVYSGFRILGFRPFFKVCILESPGLSFHFAAANDISRQESITDPQGFIRSSKQKRILLSDAGSITNIEPGPITLTIMANALRISRKFVKLNT